MNRSHAGLVAVIALLPWLLLWPAPLVFTTDVLSGADQEAVQHLWGLWAAFRAHALVFVHTDRISWPTGFDFALVDPGNLPAFALGSVFGPVAGFNTVLLFGVSLMGVAGAIVTAAAGGRGPQLTLGAVAAMSTSALLSNAGEGITESFSVGWCGVALGALLLHLEHGGWRWGALAGVALGGAVWGGPYNALWCALLCGAVGIGQLRAYKRTLPVAALGFLLAAPVLWAQAFDRPDGLPGTASRARWVTPMLDGTTYRGGALSGADLVDAFVPGVLTGGHATAGHTAYVGVVALVLGVVAVARQRSRWPWLVGALAFVVLSWGPYVALFGHLVPVGTGYLLAPVGAFARAVPLFLRFTRWYRAAAVAGILLAPLAALAVDRLRWLVGVLLVVDACVLSPRDWPIVHFDGRPSPVWAALSDPGAVVDLPPVQWAFVPEGGVRDDNLLEQTWHGRADAGTFFNLSGGAASSPEVEALMGLAIGKNAAGNAPIRLANLGYRYVVLDRTRFRKGLDVAALSHALGDPIVQDGHYVVFRLPDAKETLEPDFPPWHSAVAPSTGQPGGSGPAQTGPGGWHQGGTRVGP